MLVTFCGIWIVGNEEQPLNEYSGIVLMPLPILTNVIEEQPLYLYITTSQHLTYKKVEKRSGIFDN